MACLGQANSRGKILFDKFRAMLFFTARRTMNNTFANLKVRGTNAQGAMVHQAIWRSCRDGVGNVEVIF